MNNEMNKTSQATPEELKQGRRRCWWTGCKNVCRMEHMGWRWCFKHWWFCDVLQGETWSHRWVAIKWSRFIFHK